MALQRMGNGTKMVLSYNITAYGKWQTICFCIISKSAKLYIHFRKIIV